MHSVATAKGKGNQVSMKNLILATLLTGYLASLTFFLLLLWESGFFQLQSVELKATLSFVVLAIHGFLVILALRKHSSD